MTPSSYGSAAPAAAQYGPDSHEQTMRDRTNDFQWRRHNVSGENMPNRYNRMPACAYSLTPVLWQYSNKKLTAAEAAYDTLQALRRLARAECRFYS